MGSNDIYKDIFAAKRRDLLGIAYRMLGSLSEAEDAVQDAWIRWDARDLVDIKNPPAYLSKIVTRICLDRLRKLRSSRETYVGTWLPEPILVDSEMTIDPVENSAKDVSYALMLAIERLSPRERAAFILHDVFDLEYSEVANAIDGTESNCRKLASRAREHIRAAKPRFDVGEQVSTDIINAFHLASLTGDAAKLTELLAGDATLHSDGGGKKTAAINAIQGAQKIIRLFQGLARKPNRATMQFVQTTWINGLPGVVLRGEDGTVQTTALEISDGLITGIYVTRNPEKLRAAEAFIAKRVH